MPTLPKIFRPVTPNTQLFFLFGLGQTQTEIPESTTFHHSLQYFWDKNNFQGQIYMGLVVKKPVFGVSNKLRFKPACSATDTS